MLLAQGCSKEEDNITKVNPYGDGNGKAIIFVSIVTNPLPKNPFPLTLKIDGVAVGTISSGFNGIPTKSQLCDLSSSPSAEILVKKAGTYNFSLSGSAGSSNGVFTVVEGECKTTQINI